MNNSAKFNINTLVSAKSIEDKFIIKVTIERLMH
jgi:hypothetical protein